MADISTLEQPLVQPFADAEMTLTSEMLQFHERLLMKVDFKTFKTFQKHVIVITLTYFVEIGISRFFYPSLEALSQPTSVSRTCCTCLLLSSRFQQTVSAVPCLPLQLPNVGLKIFVDLALFLCLTPIVH
jgi:hypothetical protein